MDTHSDSNDETGGRAIVVDRATPATLPKRGKVSGRTPTSGRRRGPPTLIPPQVKAAFRLDVIIAAVFLGVMFLFGGSSRFDASTQIFVRLTSLVVIGFALWRMDRDRWSRCRLFVLMTIATAAIPAIQLVPLPPGLWAALPGHGFYATALSSVGLSDVWRPLSMAPNMTLNSLLAFLPIMAAALVFGSIDHRIQAPLVSVLIGLLLVSVLFSVLQLTTTSMYFYTITNFGSVVGSFANRNHQALFLSLCFPLLVAWLAIDVKEPGKRSLRPFAAICIAAVIFPLLLVAGSRAGILIGIVGALLSSIMLLGNRSRGRTRGPRDHALFGFPVLVGGAAIAFAVLSSRDVALQRLLASGQPELRTENIPLFFRMINEFFPFGAGFGTFDNVFRRFELDATLAPSYLNHVHNDLLEIIIEGGVGPLILLGIFTVWLMWRGWGLWRHRARAPIDALGRAGTIAIFMMGIASTVDYPLRTPLLGVMLVLFSVWIGSRRAAVTTADLAA